MSTLRLLVSCVAPFWLCAAALPSAAQSDTDACSLLSAAEVGAAAGVSVGQGTHVTPTYVKTCTWVPSPSDPNVRAVTLYLQTAAAYDGGKSMAREMAAAAKGAAVQGASVGDDGYYFVAGEQVGLLVKKGSASFKVTIYATIPVSKKEEIELALAKRVLARL
jgi:hypothetical protein